MNPVRLACCLASVALLAAGCTTPPPPPDSLVIGILAPLAGPDSAAGSEAVNGAQLAVDVINGSYASLSIPFGPELGLPGLRGAMLDLVSADTASTTANASAGVTSLIEQRGAVAMVVADTAETAAAAGSLVQRLRVPVIDARSTADYLTELGMDWYFRTGPTDSKLAESAFALLRQQPRASTARITLVTEVGGDSASAAAHIRDLAARTASSIVTQLEVSGSDAVGQQVANRLIEKHPHAIFAWAHTAAGANAIMTAVARLDQAPPLIGLGQGFRRLDQPPTPSSTLMRTVQWSAELAQRSPAAKQVAKLYQERFGKPMTAAAADAFTAVIALAVAMNTARSSEPAAIRTALRQTTLPATQMIMPWNGLRFGADGQNPLAAAVVEQWQQQSFRLVYPVELASGPAQWLTAGSAQ